MECELKRSSIADAVDGWRLTVDPLVGRGDWASNARFVIRKFQFSLRAALVTALGGLLACGAAAADTPTLELRQPLLAAVAAEGEGATPLLIESLESPDRVVRMTAAHLLASLPVFSAAAIEEALAAGDDRVRSVVIDRIVAAGHLDEFLETILSDPSERIVRRIRLQLVPAVYVGEDGTLSDGFIDQVQAIYAGAPREVRLRIASIVTDYPTTVRSRAFLETMVSDARPGIASLAAEAMVDHINGLISEREYQAILDEYSETDVEGWPAELAYGLHYGLGLAHYQLRNDEDAKRELAAAIGHQPNRRALLLAARNYRSRLGDPEKAMEHYIAAANTSVGPALSVLRSSRLEGAALLRDAGRYDEAIEIIVPGIDENQGARKVLMMLTYASILKAKGDTAEAVALYRELLDSGELSEAQTENVRQAIAEIKG